MYHCHSDISHYVDTYNSIKLLFTRDIVIVALNVPGMSIIWGWLRFAQMIGKLFHKKKIKIAVRPCNGTWNIYLAHQSDCNRYYFCFLNRTWERKCPTGLHWNQLANACDLVERAHCIHQILNPAMKPANNWKIPADGENPNQNPQTATTTNNSKTISMKRIRMLTDSAINCKYPNIRAEFDFQTSIE